MITKKPVQAMCQVKDCVWMLLEGGTLAAVSSDKHFIGHETTKQEFSDEDLATMITIHDHDGLFALAYRSGSLYFITSHLKFSLDESAELQSLGRAILDNVSTRQKQIEISHIAVSSFTLCTIEICRQKDSHYLEVWCGCDGGTIEIYSPPDNVTEAKCKSEIEMHEYSKDIPSDSNIMQLKCHSISTSASLVFALHDSGGVISCWSIGDQPTLTAVIKPSNLTSPGIETHYTGIPQQGHHN